ISSPPTSSLLPYTTLFRSSFLSFHLQLVLIVLLHHLHNIMLTDIYNESYFHFLFFPLLFSDFLLRRIYTTLHYHGLELMVLSKYLYPRSEEHTSELQSRFDLVCRLLLFWLDHLFHTFPTRRSSDLSISSNCSTSPSSQYNVNRYI